MTEKRKSEVVITKETSKKLLKKIDEITYLRNA
jgi:hypothetical protein